ncbi:DUF5305 domain-containing protein [Halovivax gelatinilyticus]|uniref:DUF5305 domain-containing protein n=1 Tax=Halovivax gelatinilyticus TaxID=2961597 RepID=UPI0020CA8F18|nr:DUF5305 domain-containing protein [Halovivax gelatinilyticus]
MIAHELSDHDRRSIRTRTLLNRWFVAVVAIAIVAFVLGGWGIYTAHVDPGTDESVEVVGTWSEQPELSHQASVAVENPVFETGDVLADRPLYYADLMPELEGVYAYSFDGDITDGSLSVTANAYVLYQATDDGVSYWEETESLESVSTEAVEPGEAVPLSFEVNVSDLESRIDEIEASLGASVGTTETLVVVDTTVSGTVDGTQIANAHTARFDVSSNGGTYAVETETGGLHDAEITESVHTDRSYGPVRTYGSVVVFVLSLAGIAGLVYARETDALEVARAERRAVAVASEREAFADWLSVGHVPEAELDGPRIDVDSLPDIVDVAIDCDRRVIEDRMRGAYFVQDLAAYYVYEPQLPDEVTDLPSADRDRNRTDDPVELATAGRSDPVPDESRADPATAEGTTAAAPVESTTDERLAEVDAVGPARSNDDDRTTVSYFDETDEAAAALESLLGGRESWLDPDDRHATDGRSDSADGEPTIESDGGRDGCGDRAVDCRDDSDGDDR